MPPSGGMPPTSAAGQATRTDTAERGVDESPYRAGFGQIVCVAENDAEAERLYARHLLYFYNRNAPWSQNDDGAITPAADQTAVLPLADGTYRVEVTDPADQTPYLYVSTREPQALVAAIRAAQGRD